ncbi:MAG TPA: flagellar hook capping FlgD N-terminal domain-containing protein [Allosphingosinicella sp.]|nr:flagellar hook capping FlgD N-terminal domain-containing protein [Allosphingosinicella sp.]
MALAPVSGASPAASTAANGLDFQSLLKIILTQLTYQDPLKPLDNFQFVSQLAQFSQLQQGQTLNDQLTSLIAAQAATQATSLLGRTVDFGSGQALQSGTVKAVSFAGGHASATIETSGGQTVSGVAISDITQVR